MISDFEKQLLELYGIKEEEYENYKFSNECIDNYKNKINVDALKKSYEELMKKEFDTDEFELIFEKNKDNTDTNKEEE